ncbi:MAG: c-type cytochrome, partial [Myxococcota bacterium]
MLKTLVRFLLGTALLVVGGTVGQAFDRENHPGRAIYQKLCTSCHGDDGMGAEDNFDVDPLLGTRSLESLIGKIERTMPEDEEHLCVGEDARLVGEYVYHAFYSEEAQNRGKIITPDLTRLTSEQLRNSVTDLIGSFRNPNFSPDNNQPGLRGAYTLDNRKR